MRKSRLSRPSFPTCLRTLLLRRARADIEHLRGSVLGGADHSSSRPAMAMTSIHPLAWLHATPFPGNDCFGDRDVLAAAVEVGDLLAAVTGPGAEQRFGQFATTFWNVGEWVVLAWLDAWPLLERHLSPAARRRWRAAFTHTLNRLERKVASYAPQQRFTSYSFDTSPNHAISYAADLLVGGVVLDNPRWRELAEDFADRFVAYQTPAGYWPEGHGPVGGYQGVSLAGVARFHAMVPKAAYRQAMARALDYHETITYPDCSFVALIDKRQRYNPSPGIRGLHGFTFLPRGRALFRRFHLRAAEAAGDGLTLHMGSRLLENYLYYRPGPIPPYRPWTGQRLLENHACFCRHAGWQYDFAVNPVIVHPTSSFRLDHQNLYSVWHESVGAIVPGSQDKNHPAHNTFFTPAGGPRLGILVGGRLGTAGEPKYVDALYASGFTGRVAFDPPSAAALRFSAANVGRRRMDNVRFNVPLQVGVGSAVRVAGRTHTLSARRVAIPVAAGAPVTIFDGKVEVTSRTPGTLIFPCRPFHPYGKGNRSTLDMAFLRLEIPLTPRRPEARIQIRLT